MKRQRNKKHLVLTKAFYGLLAEKEENLVSKAETTIFDGTNPARLVNDLEQIRYNRGINRIHIFDVANIPDDKVWAFVEDGINRSGTNPLRQLSGLSENRFIDVGHLYMVPKGQSGITILSLGARFKEEEGSKKATCGHLHNGAIVAHTMGFEVTAVVVTNMFFKRFGFNEIESLC